MANLEPQATGNRLGSRNPFLGLITPQPTGESSSASTGQPNGVTSTSGPMTVDPSKAHGDEPVAPPPPPKVIRQRTGILNSSSAPDVLSSAAQVPVSTPQQSVSQTESSPPPLPRRPTEQSNNPPSRNRAPSPTPTLDILQEDLPPEYTPGPDSMAGEQSVEFGPLRPFQDTAPRPGPQPLPNRPFVMQYRVPAGTSRNPGSLSQVLGTLVATYLADRNGSNNGYTPPRTQGSYGASFPPQPAVQTRPSMSYNSPQMPGSWSQYPGQRPRARTPEPRSPPLNDGKPTVRASPGHPLIRNGQVLVYPLGYECRKCFNKGFKPVFASTFDATPRALAPGDPSNPCKHCWRHYAQLYTPNLAQQDWTNTVETNFQRPISELNIQPQGMIPPVNPVTFNPNNTMRPAMTGPPPMQQQRTGGPPGQVWMQQNGQGRGTFSPGAPRIGGRVCPRCHGTGRIRVFILDAETCGVCRGTGRVF
ncbi:hypothetical protein CPB86DRAFT_782313 [Serendipita vermifera]|nr:hypothetical protein CPB86DRAFT_782313 [Serendipita vermifera]